MKIALVSECYHPINNGVVNCVQLIKDGLESEGHIVNVVTPNLTKNPSKGVLQVPSVSVCSKRGYHGSFPWFFQKALSAIQESDIVHSHHPFVLGSWANALAKRFEKPFVLTNHTQYWTYADHILGTLSVSPIKSYLSWFYASCTGIVVPSQEIEREVRTLTNTPTFHIPNGINVRWFRQGSPQRMRFKLGISKDEKVLLYVGRIAPEKSVVDLIQSLALCRTKFAFVVVGDGPDIKQLQELSSYYDLDDRVYFVGSVPYIEVSDYFAASDVFVTASTSEVHPLVLLEAQTSGLPCVAAPGPGNNEIILNGETGFLRPPGIQFAKAVDLLLSHNDIYQEIRNKVAACGDNFAIENSIQKLISLYHQLLNR